MPFTRKLRSRLAAGAGAVALLAAASPAVAHAADTRAAILTGAAEFPYTVAGWQAGNTAIGPLQTQRIFYSGALPASFTGSYCDQLEKAASNAITCVISYKTQTTNVAGFVAGIPATDHVIMIFHHEPENDTFSGSGTNGQNFVSQFEAQSTLITNSAAAAGNSAEVKVAMAAMAWQYQSSSYHGYSCSYIPPDQYVAYYLTDIYEPAPNGRPLNTGPVASQWNNWLACVNAANNANPHPRKALGIAEYGLGTLAGDSVRASTITADDAYLKANFTNFALWEYWDENNAVNGGCTASNCDWQITGDSASTASVAERRAGQLDGFLERLRPLTGR